MNLGEKMRRRLKLNRPSLRARSRPPKQRSPVGRQFSVVNLPVSLALQHCRSCAHVQYPPTELCSICLDDALTYRETSGHGVLLARSALHHSLWEFFKRRLRSAPWLIGSVKLDVGPVVIVHIGCDTIKAGDPVQVFSHTDVSQEVVLVAAPSALDLTGSAARLNIISSLGLDQPALRKGGI